MEKPHCKEKVSDTEQVIYRVRLAGPETDDGRLLRDIEWWVRSGLSHPQLSPYLLEKLFGFAILVEHPDRVERLKELVKKRETLTGSLIHIEDVPGPLRLAAALRERKQKRETRKT